MSRLLRGMVVALALAAPVVAGAQAVNRLEFVRRPELVNCNDAPCFRLDLNAVGANDQPLSIDTRGPLDRWTVLRDGVRQTVFYVTAKEGAGAKTAGRGRYLLLLIDVSGSMLNRDVPGTTDTRFDAAKKALVSWADTLKEGVDHVAIVPFESHHVVRKIDEATFADSSAQIGRQIDDLPMPLYANNTALYSAIVSGLKMLETRAREDPVLLVLTDGVNDVKPPPVGKDDQDLLGDDGLKDAREAAERAGIPLFTIGFGSPGQKATFDEQKLRSLASPHPSNYRRVSNGEELLRFLENARAKLTSGVQLLVGPVAETKAQLTNSTVSFKVSYTEPSGQTLETQTDVPWVAPALTEPPPGPSLEGEEFKAYIATPAGSEVKISTLVRRPLVLLMYGAILALLWFGIPRIVWPERYLARPAAPPPSSARPPAPAWAPPQRPGPPPPGGSRQPQRGPAPKGGETMYADPRGGGRQAPSPPESTVYIRPDTGKFRPPDKPGPKR